jgi:signal peptidase II
VPTRRRRLVAALVLVAVLVLVLDQASKAWALGSLTEGERTPLLEDLFGLQLMFNPGAAFSFATGMTWIFTVAALGVVVVVVRVADRLGSRGWALGLGLLLGGAVGNLIDRLLRPPAFGRGHVVDFLAYGDLFIGNVADIAIVAAAALIVLLSARGIAMDGTRAGAGAGDPAADEHASGDLLPRAGDEAEADGAPTTAAVTPAVPAGPAATAPGKAAPEDAVARTETIADDR